METGPIDTHAHLDQLTDPLESLARARAAGLAAVVGVGMDLASNRTILELTEHSDGLVWPALGAHPWNVDPDLWEENQKFLEDHLPGAVALGEVGLDYKVKVKKELQKQAFKRALELAADLDKPVMVHARYSHDSCLELLDNAGVKKAVFHWYSGPTDLLDRILAQGFLISATPALAYSPVHRQALAHAPLDRVLIETDCPVEYQGVASQPSDLLTTVRLLAEVRGVEQDEIIRQTTKNALIFLNRDI